MVSWSARSLFPADPEVRAAKACYFRELLEQYDVIAVQEAHGGRAEFEVLFPAVLGNTSGNTGGNTSFWGFFNDEGPAGHTFTLIRRSISTGAAVAGAVLVPSRVQRVTVAAEDGETIFWNFHNYDISADEYRQIAGLMEDDEKRCRADPRHTFTIFLGDFNFLAPGDSYRYLDKPEAAPDAGTDRPGQAVLGRILSRTTDAGPGLPTHYFATNFSLSRIDRIHFCAPSWYLRKVKMQARAHERPEVLHQRSLSDHSPVGLAVGAKRRKAAAVRRIAPWILRSAAYRRTFRRLKQDFCPWLDLLPAGPKLLEHKGWIREAARLTRNEHLLLHPRDAHAVEMVEDSVARAVLAQDLEAAVSLSRLSPVAAEALDVSGGQVALTDPLGFEAKYATRRHNALNDEAAALLHLVDGAEALPRGSLIARAGSLTRLARQFAPVDKRRLLMAVRFTSAEHLARILSKGIDPFDTQLVLLEGWEGSFLGRAPQPEVSKAFLDAHARRWPVEMVSAPSRSGTRRSIERARNAVPGPDGIPPCAYAETPGADEAVFEATEELGMGRLPYFSFNEQALFFIPKGGKRMTSSGSRGRCRTSAPFRLRTPMPRQLLRHGCFVSVLWWRRGLARSNAASRWDEIVRTVS